MQQMNLAFEEYRHQVGGHCRLVKPKDSSKVYKPLVENEHKFYEKLAGLGASSAESGPLQILRQFVPKYYGATEIAVTSDRLGPSPSTNRTGRQTLPADPSPGPASSSSSSAAKSQTVPPASSSSSASANVRATGERPIAESPRRLLHAQDGGGSFFTNETSADATGTGTRRGPEIPSAAHLPSQNQNQNEQQAGSSSSSSSGMRGSVVVPGGGGGVSSSSSSGVTARQHIILEDLVDGFRKPCVLDIKMGRRQRKLNASPEKEERQRAKSHSTTSYALGFRLCGCQVYNRRNDMLCYRDKYWGRKLTAERVTEAIHQWFYNGVSCHLDLIAVLVEKLETLMKCLNELRHWRFWSSSLLIVYDGGINDIEEKLQSVDVRMIDFANTIFLPDNPSPDEDYLFGLKNLLLILADIWKQHQRHDHTPTAAPSAAAFFPPVSSQAATLDPGPASCASSTAHGDALTSTPSASMNVQAPCRFGHSITQQHTSLSNQPGLSCAGGLGGQTVCGHSSRLHSHFHSAASGIPGGFVDEDEEMPLAREASNYTTGGGDHEGSSSSSKYAPGDPGRAAQKESEGRDLGGERGGDQGGCWQEASSSSYAPHAQPTVKNLETDVKATQTDKLLFDFPPIEGGESMHQPPRSPPSVCIQQLAQHVPSALNSSLGSSTSVALPPSQFQEEETARGLGGDVRPGGLSSSAVGSTDISAFAASSSRLPATAVPKENVGEELLGDGPQSSPPAADPSDSSSVSLACVKSRTGSTATAALSGNRVVEGSGPNQQGEKKNFVSRKSQTTTSSDSPILLATPIPLVTRGTTDGPRHSAAGIPGGKIAGASAAAGVPLPNPLPSTRRVATDYARKVGAIMGSRGTVAVQSGGGAGTGTVGSDGGDGAESRGEREEEEQQQQQQQQQQREGEGEGDQEGNDAIYSRGGVRVNAPHYVRRALSAPSLRRIDMMAGGGRRFDLPYMQLVQWGGAGGWLRSGPQLEDLGAESDYSDGESLEGEGAEGGMHLGAEFGPLSPLLLPHGGAHGRGEYGVGGTGDRGGVGGGFPACFPHWLSGTEDHQYYQSADEVASVPPFGAPVFALRGATDKGEGLEEGEGEDDEGDGIEIGGAASTLCAPTNPSAPPPFCSRQASGASRISSSSPPSNPNQGAGAVCSEPVELSRGSSQSREGRDSISRHDGGRHIATDTRVHTPVVSSHRGGTAAAAAAAAERGERDLLRASVSNSQEWSHSQANAAIGYFHHGSLAAAAASSGSGVGGPTALPPCGSRDRDHSQHSHVHSRPPPSDHSHPPPPRTTSIQSPKDAPCSRRRTPPGAEAEGDLVLSLSAAACLKETETEAGGTSTKVPSPRLTSTSAADAATASRISAPPRHVCIHCNAAAGSGEVRGSPLVPFSSAAHSHSQHPLQKSVRSPPQAGDSGGRERDSREMEAFASSAASHHSSCYHTDIHSRAAPHSLWYGWDGTRRQVDPAAAVAVGSFHSVPAPPPVQSPVFSYQSGYSEQAASSCHEHPPAQSIQARGGPNHPSLSFPLTNQQQDSTRDWELSVSRSASHQAFGGVGVPPPGGGTGSSSSSSWRLPRGAGGSPTSPAQQPRSGVVLSRTRASSGAEHEEREANSPRLTIPKRRTAAPPHSSSVAGVLAPAPSEDSMSLVLVPSGRPRSGSVPADTRRSLRLQDLDALPVSRQSRRHNPLSTSSALTRQPWSSTQIFSHPRMQHHHPHGGRSFRRCGRPSRRGETGTREREKTRTSPLTPVAPSASVSGSGGLAERVCPHCGIASSVNLSLEHFGPKGGGSFLRLPGSHSFTRGMGIGTGTSMKSEALDPPRASLPRRHSERTMGDCERSEGGRGRGGRAQRGLGRESDSPLGSGVGGEEDHERFLVTKAVSHAEGETHSRSHSHSHSHSRRSVGVGDIPPHPLFSSASSGASSPAPSPVHEGEEPPHVLECELSWSVSRPGEPEEEGGGGER
uniref:Kinase n=1 Tax=Chromera velia CCMP2878 TaxID=1169474 RepID=A0A0G4FCR6_9ALVE|eukprot:Cvel_16208.t1-p1 / transcript=Cvel_16208.t1 / gene=Cvel_16208 / organism=Chromera_velia_CCMP2878 / gene_product=Inositol hexakisphosphate kinase 1, putative / transcript_product=Inositol hexakisphosphate kinase 1, putative / location=Cvel_scaffold1238:25203-33574(-) / protein_length=1958 / sequence_SO=supercontig / SO=protein_coding / is_pseudo=false